MLGGSSAAFWCSVVLGTITVTTASVRHGRPNRLKDSWRYAPPQEYHPKADNGDIIDLDDDALTNNGMKKISSPSKFAEDTREMLHDTNVIDPTGVLINDDVDVLSDVSKYELVTPIPYEAFVETEETNEGAENQTVSAGVPFTDDEDLQAGSGSGDIVIEEGEALINSSTETDAKMSFSKMYNQIYMLIFCDLCGLRSDVRLSNDTGPLERSPEEYVQSLLHNITQSDAAIMPTANVSVVITSEETVTPYCEEVFNVTWTPWSAWIKAGDHDIRFRRCPAVHGYTGMHTSCIGDHVETRACPRVGEKMCRTSGGDVTEEFLVGCAGMDLDDVQSADELRNPSDRKDDCEYTLYDLQYDMIIGEPVSTDGLQTVNALTWCRADDNYVTFYTPKQRCKDNLATFCKLHDVCRYEMGHDKTKTKGDLHKTCWKDSVLGGVLPDGLPDSKEHYVICQRFDKESRLGTSLGHKDAHYVTVFDTHKRIPFASMATVTSLGDDKWPDIPFMIERGLIEGEESVTSQFLKGRKKGMTTPVELTAGCAVPTCKFGAKQAMPADYEYSGYRVFPLLTPGIMGGSLARSLSVFTMTNAAPMEPTVVPGWKNALNAVRKFALNTCHIPLQTDDQDGRRHHRNGHQLPEMYLVSGTASKSNHVDVIGNDVTVPEFFWMGVCCADGADVASFAIHVYNRFEQKPTVVSVKTLEMLLRSRLYDKMEDTSVNLFPAFSGVCSAVENDASFKITIP